MKGGLQKKRYIYFARPIGADGRIKIGCSYKPVSRLIALSVWCAYPIEIIAIAPGGFDVERQLHDYFAADRLHREWFRSSPGLLFVIGAMSKGLPFEDAVADLERMPARIAA